MRSLITSALLGIGAFALPTTANASWLSESWHGSYRRGNYQPAPYVYVAPPVVETYAYVAPDYGYVVPPTLYYGPSYHRSYYGPRYYQSYYGHRNEWRGNDHRGHDGHHRR
jgi:hypothetical protein